MSNNFFGNHVLSVSQFTRVDIEALFLEARRMKASVENGKTWDTLKGKIMTALFYEPSSRTFGSFVAGMQRLGGGIIPLQGVAYSSVSKGETLEDTVATFAELSDIIVLRHPEAGSAAIAARSSRVPIINAGDGIGEHPTQALLDLFTIQSHFVNISELTVTFVGDLANGRTVHSLTKLFHLYQPRKIYFVSPKELAMPAEHIQMLTNTSIQVEQRESLDEILANTDVLYMTRVQKERFENQQTYEKLKTTYVVTAKTMKLLKRSVILMHPFPRVGEIASEVDRDRRAVYLSEQIANGLYVRMALLALILRKQD